MDSDLEGLPAAALGATICDHSHLLTILMVVAVVQQEGAQHVTMGYQVW